MITHVSTVHSPVLFHVTFDKKPTGQSGTSHWQPVLPHTGLCHKGPPRSLSWACSASSGGHFKCSHSHTPATPAFHPSLLSHPVWSSRAGSGLQTWRHSENSRKKGSVPSKGTWHWPSIWAPTIWGHLLKDWHENIIYMWMSGFTTRPSRSQIWAWTLFSSLRHRALPCIQCLSLIVFHNRISVNSKFPRLHH